VVITLSRQIESGGEEIGRMVAERAELRVLDRAILEHIAEREGMPASHLEIFDETVPGLIQRLIVEWSSSVSHVSYVRRLIHVLVQLERQGQCLIVGRGGAFALADPGTLHVRVIAPMPNRVESAARRHAIPLADAERLIRRSDEEQARFIRAAFGADIGDPAHYDLTLNTSELTLEECAEIILGAARAKARRRQVAAEAPEDLPSQLSRSQHQTQFPRVRAVVWRRYQRGLRG